MSAKPPEILDKMTDLVLSYRPPSETLEKAKKHKRKPKRKAAKKPKR